MRSRRLLFGALVVATCTAALLFGGVLSGSEPAPEIVGASTFGGTVQTETGQLLAGFSTGDTAGFVRHLEQRVATEPGDGQALSLLGLAYQQRARETGDPTYYSRSGEALRRAAAHGAPAPLVIQGRASLANARHEFAQGRALARRALAIDPENAGAYGSLGDALLNTGRYKEAFAAYDRMVLLSPSIASLSRISNARELRGHSAGAREAIRFALGIDQTVPEHVAWTRVQLGNLAFNHGRLGEAEAAYRAALKQLPGYVHANAGRARVEAADGDYAAAIRRLQAVVAALPIPAYVIQLGDTLDAAGRTRAAKREYSLVAAIERLFAANGVRTELQTAVFDLDHGRNAAAALERARAAYRSAPGIYAADAVAWGLFRAGRCRQARIQSARALRLGTEDALLTFHRAMIERCLGSPSARSWFARALEINPNFSLLWAPVARRALAGESS